MVDSISRALIFWGVCIPLRSYLTLRAKDNREDWLRLFALAIGTRWVTGGEVGNEGVFGGPAFWKDERPLHGVLWLSYGATGVWQFLAADTGLGFPPCSFLIRICF